MDGYPVVINNIFFLKINSIENASAANVGQNFLAEWTNSDTLSFGPSQQVDTFLATKRNMGFGEDNGDLSPTYFPLNIILDQDVLDNNANKNSLV